MNKIGIIGGLAALLLAACTPEVELCYGDHPHRGELNISFDWGAYETMRPDSMYVVAVRSVNLLKCGFWVSATPDAATHKVEGQMLFPLSDVQLTADRSAAGLPDRHKLWLHAGEYIMLAFNGSNRVFEHSLKTFVQNSGYGLDSLMLRYKSYDKLTDTPEFSKYANWIDRNPYSGYVLGEVEPIFKHSFSPLKVPVSERKTPTVACRFKPTPITQKVTLRFDIERKENGVQVDSVHAEMSGIPSEINIQTGAVRGDKTYKVLFSPQSPRFGQTADMAPLSVEGTFDVTGIVSSRSAGLVTGPGILQVNIYTQTVNEKGYTVYRVFKAGMNLYNLLKSNPSLTLDNNTGELKQTVKNLKLVIKAPLQITRETVLENAENGLDVWLPAGTIDVDI